MGFKRHSNRRTCTRALWALCLAGITTPGLAQDITAEQIEAFTNLPASQQQTLREQFQNQGADTSTPPESPEVVQREGAGADLTDEAQGNVVQGLDTLVITLRGGRDNPLVEQLRGTHRYQTDQDGVLNLYGFDPIPLRGLSAPQIALRLQTEPLLENADIKVQLLPVAPLGAAALSRFGYDLFSGAPSTFAPATDIPVPTNYVMGPGDVLSLTLFGKENRNYKLAVDRNGDIQVPEIGTINVAGRRFDDVRDDLSRRVSEQMIGVQNSITLDKLRSIRVFLLGESANPGAYTISALSTMTHALYVSGGVKANGSLRNVQLKRDGRIVRRLDLYDLLLDGDTSDDAQLQPGDVIFIPPVGPQLSIHGAIKRPAIYEFRPGMTAAQAIELAGGATAELDRSRLSLFRIGENGGTEVKDVQLAGASALRLRDGDVLELHELDRTVSEGVLLSGHVRAPGLRAWSAGIRLSDVLAPGDLLPRTDQDYGLIVSSIGRVNPRSFKPGLALSSAGRQTLADPILRVGDEVILFDLNSPRAELLEDDLDRMRRAARLGAPAQIVGIRGRVAFPGQYPLEAGMTIEQLIRSAGGLTVDAFGLRAEITRRAIGSQELDTQTLSVELQDALQGSSSGTVLQPGDTVVIRQLPEWGESFQVTIRGEVRFPGEYLMQESDTLRDLVMRAGGLTDRAHPGSAVFTRAVLRKREAEELSRLRSRLRQQLAFANLAASSEPNGSGADNLAQAFAVLREAEASEVSGRLVIDLEQQLAAGALPIEVQDGDTLVIPSRPTTITTLGEVRFPTSHVYAQGSSILDYVNLSGGITDLGDKRGIYVVRANGRVERVSQGLFGNNPQARPGDTIVVPLDVDRTKPLTLWTNVSRIMYQIALSVAAFNSVGAF